MGLEVDFDMAGGVSLVQLQPRIADRASPTSPAPMKQYQNASEWIHLAFFLVTCREERSLFVSGAADHLNRT